MNQYEKRKWVYRGSAALLGLLLVILLSWCGCVTRGIRPPDGASMHEIEMTVTGYDSCGKCCNWRRDWRGRPVIASGPNAGKAKKVGVTAANTIARKGVIAADTRYYPFGTVMYVPGYGYGSVEDRGGAIKGRQRIDIYFSTHKDALQWGRVQKKVKVWLVR